MDDDGSNNSGELRLNPEIKRRWATVALMAVNVLMFVAMMLAGASPLYADRAAILAGGVEPSRVWDGELWRLFVACFVHLGVWHVALNVWVLWQLGQALERMVGPSRLVLVYVSSGVFGFALSLALRAVPTAGASGAIFGITGALLAIAFLLRHKELGQGLLHALIPFVGATFLLGFLVDFIDNTAHVGGLVFGFLIAYGLCAGDPNLTGPADAGRLSEQETLASVERERREKWWGLTALITCAALFVVVVAYGARPIFSPRYHAAEGLHALRDKRVDDAKKHMASAARYGKEDGATLVLIGRMQAENAKNDDERAAALATIRSSLSRFDGETTYQRHVDALLDLALFGGSEDVPFDDHRTVNALCDAALDALSPGEEQGADLKNDCAWLKLKSGDAAVHDPKRGLELARQAVADSKGESGVIVHTLAEALAQNGDADEAVALLEKLAAQGRGKELPGGDAWLLAERRRIARIHGDRVGSP